MKRFSAVLVVLAMLLTSLMLPLTAGAATASDLEPFYEMDYTDTTLTLDKTNTTMFNTSHSHAKGFHYRNLSAETSLVTDASNANKQVLKIATTSSTAATAMMYHHVGYSAATVATNSFGDHFVTSYKFAVEAMGEADLFGIGLVSSSGSLKYQNGTFIRGGDTLQLLIDPKANITMSATGIPAATAEKTVDLEYGTYYTVSVVYDVESWTVSTYLDGELLHVENGWTYQGNNVSTLYTNMDTDAIGANEIRFWNYSKALTMYFERTACYAGTMPVEYTGSASAATAVYSYDFNSKYYDVSKDALTHTNWDTSKGYHLRFADSSIVADGDKNVLRYTNSSQTNSYSLLYYYAGNGNQTTDPYGNNFVVSYNFAIDAIGEGDALDFGIINTNTATARYQNSVFIKAVDGKPVLLIGTDKTPNSAANAAAMTSAIATVGLETGRYYTLSLAYDREDQTVIVFLDGEIIGNQDSFRSYNSDSVVDTDANTDGAVYGIGATYIKVWNNTKATTVSFANMSCYRGYADVDYKASETVFEQDYTTLTLSELGFNHGTSTANILTEGYHFRRNGSGDFGADTNAVSLATDESIGKQVMTFDNSVTTDEAYAIAAFSLLYYHAGNIKAPIQAFGNDFIVSYNINVESIGAEDVIELGLMNSKSEYQSSVFIKSVDGKPVLMVGTSHNPTSADNIAAMTSDVMRTLEDKYYTLSIAYDTDDFTVRVYLDGELIGAQDGFCHQSGSSSNVQKNIDTYGIATAYFKTYNNSKATVVNFQSAKCYQGIYPVEYSPAPTPEAPADGVVFRGVQESSEYTVEGTDYISVRFVTSYESVADYYAIGYEISYSVDGGAVIGPKEFNCDTVYEKILGSDASGVSKTYTAKDDFSASYISAQTFTKVPASGTYTFTVTPYVYTAEDAQRTDCGTYTVVYTDGVFVKCSAS